MILLSYSKKYISLTCKMCYVNNLSSVPGYKQHGFTIFVGHNLKNDNYFFWVVSPSIHLSTLVSLTTDSNGVDRSVVCT
jgi:hypothetical protein